MNLQDFKDSIAKAAHGITKEEALQKGICINCKKPPVINSETGRREYLISGIGDCCWDLLTKVDEDENDTP